MVANNKDRVNIAVVGLGFGVHFLPIYLNHPHVGDVAVVDLDAKLAADVAASHGIEACYGDISSMLRDRHWDAVHILAPVQFHADYTRRVLQSGKHCACAVPMATTLDDLASIVDLQRDTGLRYMMMETSAYTRELLTAHQAFHDGELGRIAMYDGFHLQNLREYPTYWQGFPPMHYATHALSPILKLTSARVVSVVAHGGGELLEENRIGGYSNNFGIESGLFSLSTPDIVVKVTVSFSRISRSYTEGFNMYCDAMSLEWPTVNDGPLRAYRMDPTTREDTTRPEPPIDMETSLFAERLPTSIRRYLEPYVFVPADGRTPRLQLAEHGGSHPHLVHEFISAIIEDRQTEIDAATAARWTAPGIVAHESATRGGETIEVPIYDG